MRQVLDKTLLPRYTGAIKVTLEIDEQVKKDLGKKLDDFLNESDEHLDDLLEKVEQSVLFFKDEQK
jgi:formiminotetrahydrofolate cyclodeaminase